MSNIIDKIQLSGVTYDIGGGGGKAIEAGRGISVTTGETADTVSFDLPISAGTGENSIVGNIAQNTASGKNALALGGFYNSKYSYGLSVASGLGAVSFGGNAEGEQSFAAASMGSTASGQRSVTIAGYQNNSKGVESLTSGRYVKAENFWECSLGYANVSHKANTTWGDSGNTLFSVGNGTSSSARHNAFEIRQNGDIYLSLNGQDVKLQDQLGGGGSSYSAGTGIDITNDVISVTGKQDTLISGTNIKTVNNESILGSGNITIQGGGSPVVELTQAQYDALQTIDPDTIYVITDAQGGDLSQYMTSAQTVNAISTAVASKVDTSAITTTITSSSTNSQVPSAKAVYNIVGNIETLLSQI